MHKIDVAIVGGGPRALSLLERLSVLGDQLSAKVTVHIVDPGPPGHGSHGTSQHWCLLTNTLASQVTIFAPRDSADPDSEPTGPSFTEWARASGLRKYESQFGFEFGSIGVPVSEGDYLPRAMLGAYLSDAFHRLSAAMPPQITVIHRRDRVVDLEIEPAGKCNLLLASGATLSANYCFLTTGHGKAAATEADMSFREFVAAHSSRNGRLGYFSTPYPLDSLEAIQPGSVVAVQGLGLTAYDVIASLTLGRGGRFIGEGQRLTYQPSGREPVLKLFSRNSLPYAARGINQKGIAGRHVARFFTRDAIEALRRQHLEEAGSRQLDFNRDVWPLLEKEMAYAYRCAGAGRACAPDRFVAGEDELGAIRDIVEPSFLRRAADHHAFVRSVRAHLVGDLAAAFEGNLTSPIKAATDVIRDTRDGLAAAVEFSGLTPASHRHFCEQVVPMMNRVAFGPPRHRNAELLALMDAGLITWAGGSGASVTPDPSAAKFAVTTAYSCGPHRIEADVLIVARLTAYRPAECASPLTANLLRRGLIREYHNGDYHPYGIDIDRHHHPISVSGVPARTLWAIGYPAEGARFYTYALPRPLRRSVQVLDAEQAVTEMLGAIAAGVVVDDIDNPAAGTLRDVA